MDVKRQINNQHARRWAGRKSCDIYCLASGLCSASRHRLAVRSIWRVAAVSDLPDRLATTG